MLATLSHASFACAPALLTDDNLYRQRHRCRTARELIVTKLYGRGLGDTQGLEPTSWTDSGTLQYCDEVAIERCGGSESKGWGGGSIEEWRSV